MVSKAGNDKIPELRKGKLNTSPALSTQQEQPELVKPVNMNTPLSGGIHAEPTKVGNRSELFTKWKSKTEGLVYLLKTDETSLYYKLSQASLRKHTPTFALVITLGLIVFYYWTFLSSEATIGVVPESNLFYLTLYSIIMSLIVFGSSLLSSNKSLNNAFLYMLVLSISVYTLLGGVVYNDMNNSYAVTFVAVIIMMGAVIYPNFWVFLFQSLAGLGVIAVPYLLKYGLTFSGENVLPPITVLLLVFALAVVVNRYVYVFVSRMLFESESWLESSETDNFTKFLNREGFNKIYSHISQVRSGEQGELQTTNETSQKGRTVGGKSSEIITDDGLNSASEELVKSVAVEEGVSEVLISPEQGEDLGEIFLSKKTKKLYEKLYMCALLKGEVYLYFLDVDNLKRINDVFGHIEGDSAILAVADALTNIIADEGLITRWGGDEFVVLMCEKRERETVENAINTWLDNHIKKDPHHNSGGAFKTSLSLENDKGEGESSKKKKEKHTLDYYQSFYKVSVTVSEPVNIIGRHMREAILISDETLYRRKNEKRHSDKES